MTDALAMNLDASCWLWQGAKNPLGYGHLRKKGKTLAAHRYMWTLMRGSIPSGMTIDHLCRVRQCVNPQHLELVTMRENVLRGVSPAANQARQTHCKRGHPFDAVNTRIEADGARVCRACDREKHRKPNTIKRLLP